MIRPSYRVPSVDADKCRTCRRCLARSSCRVKALVRFEAQELPYVDQVLCRGCMVCVENCPFKAIALPD